MRAFFDHSPCKASRETILESYGQCGLKVHIPNKKAANYGKASEKRLQIGSISVSHFETRLTSHAPSDTSQGQSLAPSIRSAWAPIRSAWAPREQLLNSMVFLWPNEPWDRAGCDKFPKLRRRPVWLQTRESKQTDRRRRRDSVNNGPSTSLAGRYFEPRRTQSRGQPRLPERRRSGSDGQHRDSNHRCCDPTQSGRS